MRLSRNVTTALVIAGAIALWLATGQIFGHHPAEAADSAKDSKAAGASELFLVKAERMTAVDHAAEVDIKGRTEAVRSVDVKSETSGTISKIDVDKGSLVKAGDVICELQPDARQAQLEQAQAAMKQAELEYQASATLAKKGYRAPTDVADSKAKLDSANAGVREAEIELGRTKLRAPFDGVVDDRMVNVGDFVQPGGTCALVVDLDPMLVVGQVSEKDVGAIEIGQSGHARLVDGTDHEGTVRFVARSADPATRTFRVELEVPNPDGVLRDGVTADILIPVKAVMAQQISPAILSLDDKGEMGVKTVDNKDVVRFYPVKIIADAGDGVWVTGLPSQATVITVGQEYVVPGQTVKVALAGDGAKS